MKLELEVLELSGGGYIGLCYVPGRDPQVTLGTSTESKADVARRSLNRALYDSVLDDVLEEDSAPLSSLASRVATDPLTITDLLQEAANDEREVRIQYRPITAESYRAAKTKIVRPLSVVLPGRLATAAQDHGYMRGVERGRDIWRTFRIDNILRAEFV